MTARVSSAPDYDRDDRATIAVFGAVTASVMAGLCYARRIGFASPVRPIVAMLGLSLFITATPFLAWWLLPHGHYDEHEPWWRAQTFLTLFALGLSVVAGMAVPRTGVNAVWILAALGFIGAIAAVVIWATRGSPAGNLLFLAAAGVFAIWTSGVERSPQSVIVIPLFFSAVLLLAVEVKKDWARAHPRGGERSLRSDYAAWLLFLVATVGVIPSSAFDGMGIWKAQVMISEPYPIAIPVFLLSICTTGVYWRRRKSSHRKSDLVFLLVFAPAMIAAAGFLELSTMFLLLTAALGVALLGRLFRNRVVALSALLCLGAAAISYTTQSRVVVPFSYMRSYVNAPWWPWFVLVHNFWCWLYIFLRLREEDVHTVGDVRQAALHGRINDVVVVAVVVIAGWVAGEAIDTERWLALSLLMASASRWVARLRASDETRSGGRMTLGGVRLSHLWLAAIAIPLSITMILNIVRRL